MHFLGSSLKIHAHSLLPLPTRLQNEGLALGQLHIALPHQTASGGALIMFLLEHAPAAYLSRIWGSSTSGSWEIGAYFWGPLVLKPPIYCILYALGLRASKGLLGSEQILMSYSGNGHENGSCVGGPVPLFPDSLGIVTDGQRPLPSENPQTS